MPVGDVNKIGPLPRLSNKLVGEATELTVSASFLRLVRQDEQWVVFRNYIPEGPLREGLIAAAGKLWRRVVTDVWEEQIPDGSTATITWEFGGLSGTVASDVPWERGGMTVPWVIPAELASVDTSHTSFAVNFTVTVGIYEFTEPVLGSGQPKIPDDAKPVLVSWGISEGNPVVADGAPFVPGSVLKVNPVVEGTLGAPIKSVQVGFDTQLIEVGAPLLSGGQAIPPDGLPVGVAGTFTVGAVVTDTRDRRAGFTTTVTVAEYTQPVLSWSAQRVNELDVPISTGDRIAVTVDAQVHPLGGLNTVQIRVSTRPYGGSSWTEREVIDPPSLGYLGTVTIDGTYDISLSWEVLIEVQDAATLLTETIIVATDAVIVDASDGKIAVGQTVDPDGPRVQLRGPARVYGVMRADNLPVHRQSGTKPAGVSTFTVPLSGFTLPPDVSLTVEYNASVAVNAWLESRTASQIVIRSSRPEAIVHYVAEEYPWVPHLIAARATPTVYLGELGYRPVGTLIFVGRYAPSSVVQTVYTPIPTTSRMSVDASGTVVPSGNTRYQLVGGMLVAWYQGELDAVGRRGGASPDPWLGAFRSEIYEGVIPVEDAKEITNRLAREFGETVTLGPQFD